jgi:phospholipid/cholesterol/gamma-HCH transport system permease protein
VSPSVAEGDPGAADAPPEARFAHDPGGRSWVRLTGAWNLRALESSLGALEPRLARFPPDAGWDLTEVATMDHAGALVLWRAWGRRVVEPLTLRPEHAPLFERFAAPPPRQEAERPRRYPLLVRFVGRRVFGVADHVTSFVDLVGRVSLEAVHLLRHPGRIPWKEISANLYRTGAQALGITALVGFLIGVVLSYLSAQQLRAFGADVYIVNLLGVAIIRELGPVLAAILVAGRSGSAMAAQIGVMRVTEELDAMAVMGIPHTLRLVLPKTVALAIAMPLLVLWTNAIALIGGMASAHMELGISYVYFVSSLPDAVPISNLWLGLGKGVVFGMLIALIACHFGLRIKPNTESLGTGTTNSVVTAITAVILVDAIFAVMFSDIGSFL